MTTELIGGVRWGFWNATWPLAKLSVDVEGIKIRPTKWARFLAPRFPSLDLLWSEIDQVEKVRGAIPVPKNFGVKFSNVRKRLIWWGGSSSDCDALLELVAGFVPEKVAPPRSRVKVVF